MHENEILFRNGLYVTAFALRLDISNLPRGETKLGKKARSDRKLVIVQYHGYPEMMRVSKKFQKMQNRYTEHDTE